MVILFCALLTVLIEVPLTAYFLKKKDIRMNAALINLITNLTMNLFLGLFLKQRGWGILLGCETIVVLAEAVMYRYAYPEEAFGKLLKISLLTNVISFVAGEILFGGIL